MDKKQICTSACSIIREVSDYILKEFSTFHSEAIETKARNHLVSYVDKQAEKMLVEQLQNLVPDSGFLVEEGTIEASSRELRWIIDPLDGTTNFMHHLPFYCISVALQLNEVTIIGIIHEVNRNETFYSFGDQKAYLNGRIIEVSSATKLEDTIIATGFPYYDYSILDAYLEVLKHLVLNTRGVRRFGSAAMDLAYVACGRFDAYFEHSLSAWDVAAGAFIVEQAGGVVSDFNGTDHFLFGRQIIAGNQFIHPVIKELIQEKINV